MRSKNYGTKQLQIILYKKKSKNPFKVEKKKLFWSNKIRKVSQDLTLIGKIKNKNNKLDRKRNKNKNIIRLMNRNNSRNENQISKMTSKAEIIRV